MQRCRNAERGHMTTTEILPEKAKELKILEGRWLKCIK